MKTVHGFLACLILLLGMALDAQHNPGKDCIGCHPGFSLGGTVFLDQLASGVAPQVPVKLTSPDGIMTVLNPSDEHGNVYESNVSAGHYLIQAGQVTSRTWHNLPEQRSCNTCHLPGGNSSDSLNLILPDTHTQIMPGNRCTDCHHFPATMDYSRLAAKNNLNIESFIPIIPRSQVIIGDQSNTFDPEDFSIQTVRPDIFSPGFYSMFDVILAVADKNSIPVEYAYDSARKTHFISSFDGVEGEYWYHFSYDAGNGNSNELKFKRENRWDEALWRPGVWIELVNNEPLEEIKTEYLEEIQREKVNGHMIPDIRIRLNPSDYEGNPDGSGRITVSKSFKNVVVTPHRYRSSGTNSPYSKPFQPDVVTSMDILYSLVDQQKLTLATGVFYTQFASNHIDSYYVVEMGFPEEGTAHASGRHGFTYTTGNGTNFRLAHGADNKFHMTSDIAVLHAPDFSRWRWTELGNPYYENNLTALNRSVIEDHDAVDRGFNLHSPYPNPVSASPLMISFNIFEPGVIRIELLDGHGRILDVILDGSENNLGIHKTDWKVDHLPPGNYYIRMLYNGHQQVRRIAKIQH